MEINKTGRKKILHFFLSIGISYIITMYWDIFILKNTKDELLYFLISGLPQAIIPCLFIFFSYSFFASFISKMNINSGIRKLIVILVSFVFFFIIIYLNWLIQCELYYAFFDFIKEPNYYLVFTVVSIVVIQLRKVPNWRKYK